MHHFSFTSPCLSNSPMFLNLQDAPADKSSMHHFCQTRGPCIGKAAPGLDQVSLTLPLSIDCRFSDSLQLGALCHEDCCCRLSGFSHSDKWWNDWRCCCYRIGDYRMASHSWHPHRGCNGSRSNCPTKWLKRRRPNWDGQSRNQQRHQHQNFCGHARDTPEAASQSDWCCEDAIRIVEHPPPSPLQSAPRV